MSSTEDLRAWRDALVRTRMSGTRLVQSGDRRVEYRSDAELAAAIAEADRMLDAAARPTRPTVIRFHSSKGL